MNGIAGFTHKTANGSTTYYYRKNLLGDVTAIYDEAGVLQAEYAYDAWGNSTVNSGMGGIGALNPIRYRGYYWDEEIALYYLNARYYDSEVGRFISQDSIKYIAPETLNGINLFAYCLNNPVMYNDSEGTIAFLGIFITAIVGAVVGGVIGGLTAAINGKDVFAGVLIGAASGAIMGATAAIAAPMILAGGATMVTGFEVAFVGGFIAGFGSDVATQIVNENESINLESAFYSGFQYGVLNMVAGGIGAPFAYVTETSFNVVFNLIFTTQISLFGLLFDVLREKL